MIRSNKKIINIYKNKLINKLKMKKLENCVLWMKTNSINVE